MPHESRKRVDSGTWFKDPCRSQTGNLTYKATKKRTQGPLVEDDDDDGTRAFRSGTLPRKWSLVECRQKEILETTINGSKDELVGKTGHGAAARGGAASAKAVSRSRRGKIARAFGIECVGIAEFPHS
jgi:hypothetical protein